MEMLCVYCDLGNEFLNVILKIIMHMRVKCNLYDVFATIAAERTINITILYVAVGIHGLNVTLITLICDSLSWKMIV